MKFISNYKMSFLFFISGILCLIAYNIKGSSIDENGFFVGNSHYDLTSQIYRLYESLDKLHKIIN